MLEEEGILKRYICVSMEPRRRKVGNIVILPYREFLELLWNGAYTRESVPFIILEMGPLWPPFPAPFFQPHHKSLLLRDPV
jgi:hypothetical protein